MRTLTLRELNRATLARQLLLRRHRLTVTQAVERTAGLQAQWPPSPYLGLWSRLDGFTPDKLVRAVARRTVVKATLMRTTLHLVSAADYLSYAGIYRAESDPRAPASARQLQGEDADFAADGDRLAAFAAEKARSRPELLALLGRPKLRIEERSPWLVWYGLSAHAGLVNGPSSSVWRSAHGRRHVRACADLAGGGRPPPETPPPRASSAATSPPSGRQHGPTSPSGQASRGASSTGDWRGSSCGGFAMSMTASCTTFRGRRFLRTFPPRHAFSHVSTTSC